MTPDTIPSAAEAPLDLQALAELTDEDVDDLRELLNTFFAQMDEILILLDHAVQTGKVKDVERMAHKLAGSSAVCGAVALTKDLRALELCGRESRLADAPQSYATVVAQAANSRHLLQEYLAAQVQQQNS